MKRRIIPIIITCAFMFFLGFTSAHAFSLGGYQGTIKIKFSNWENLTDPANGVYPYFANNGDGVENNNGIFFITQILSDDGFNTELWASGDSSEKLTGVFYGIDTQSESLNVDGSLNVQSVGGIFDIYLDYDLSFDATQGTAGYYDTDGILHNEYAGITSGDAQLFASFNLVPGVDPLNDTTLDGDFDGGTIPGSGDAQFYGSIIENQGLYWQYFNANGYHRTYIDDNGNTQTVDADIYGINNFFANNGSTTPIQGDWDLLSEDPIRTQAVPEPTTMLLLGFGLMGLGIVGRKRFNK